MKKIIAVIVVSIITIVFLLGFIDNTPQKETNNTADIVYSINNIPLNLKSIGNLNNREQDIICAVSKGLVEVDINGNINPALAKSVDVIDNGIEYDFKIRDDVYWSDGSKITPKDIVAFFREVVTEEDNKDALLNVFGVNDYINSNKSFAETVGIVAIDDSVNIRLNSPDNNFLMELTKPQYRLRKSLLYWQDISSNFNKIIYSGDYFINSINENEVILNRSIKSNSRLAQSIHLVKDDGEDLALAAFEIGNRDIVVNPPRSELQRLKNEGKLISMPSKRAVYLAFNINNDNFSNSIKKEIYRFMNNAMEEYQNNNISMELADCSYFRDDKEDVNKLQSRNVMVNVQEDVEEPKKVILVAQESLQNKDLTDFLISWFDKNTNIILSVNLLPKEDMDTVGEKNYYDVALLNVNASLENEDELFSNLSSYLPENLRAMINNSNTQSEKEELFAEIEEELFNNYKILPLLFYNDTIAVNGDIGDNLLDGNGNIIFRNLSRKAN